MAVNHHTGLDYFSFDIDFFEDDKIQFVSARFGLKGEIIAVKLLCKIYRNGYYYQWGEDEALLFAKSVGDGCQHSFVNDVVHELVKRGFFDKDIFNSFKILTSRGIQSRYFEAAKRRKSIEVREELLLLDPKCIHNVYILKQNVYIEPENVNISPQSKVKESKVKERESNTPVVPTGGGEKTPEDHWKSLVKTWTIFYKKKFSVEPTFNGAAAKNFKSIVERLKKKVVSSGNEWSEEVAIMELTRFLENALTHSDWLKRNFLLGNIASQYDAIINPSNKKHDTHQSNHKSGGKSAGALELLDDLRSEIGFNS